MSAAPGHPDTANLPHNLPGPAFGPSGPGPSERRALTNHYKRYLSGNILPYDRGAHLESIEYGYNEQVSGSHPAGKVAFQSVNRCVERTVKDDPVGDPYPSSVCPSATAANASSYPDVPVDLKCGSSSCDQYAPTFFSVKRLERITTYKRVDDSTWRNIHRLHLRFKTFSTAWQ